MALENLVEEITKTTGLYGKEADVRTMVTTVLDALHSSAYLKPDLVSSFVSFDSNYRQAKIPLTVAQFGRLRRIHRVKDAAPTPSGLPLGEDYRSVDIHNLMHNAHHTGRIFYIENNNLVFISPQPISRLFVSWFAFPVETDPTHDWIYQRYESLVKARVMQGVASSNGAKAVAEGQAGLIAPLLTAFMADNVLNEGESQ
jgi:hypothetical protein